MFHVSPIGRRLFACLLGPGIVLALTAAAPGNPEQTIEDRIAGFRDIGSAYKNIGDELKARSPAVAKIRTSAGVIDNYTAALPGWFPPDSQPPAPKSSSWFSRFLDWLYGLFTGADAYEPATAQSHAKLEIWSQPARFKAAYRQFDVAADRMWQASKGGNIATINTEYRRLGTSCKACHDVFREERD